MRHRRRKAINRSTSLRKATVKSVLRSLILYQAIRTTKDKAKLVRPYADRLIGCAKKEGLAAKRYAFDMLGDHLLVQRLFNVIVPLFSKRNSGYTRIISLGVRRGDGADIALFEFTEKKEVRHLKKKKPAKEKLTEKMRPPEEETPKPHIKDIAERKEEKPIEKKPEKKVKLKKRFLGGIRNIFKKERDSL